jgi:hypothetical protein
MREFVSNKQEILVVSTTPLPHLSGGKARNGAGPMMKSSLIQRRVQAIRMA